MTEIPERYRQLATAEEIDREIGRIASKILTDHPSTPLFVSLLRGANPFTSKLMFEITNQQRDYHPNLDYMMVSTYGDGQQAGEPHIVTDLAPTTVVQDKSVVVIDDVLDKGVTAEFVFKHLRARGAAAIRLVVLCSKETDRLFPVEADYVGFSFDDNWLVGLGMDDAEHAHEAYRWLNEIWEVRKPVDA